MEDENTEKKISTKAYNESYFMLLKIISELFIIPLILYILLLAHIIHTSTFNPPLKAHIYLYLAKKRKILYLILLFLFIFHIIAILRVSSLEYSSSSISDTITLIVLLFYIIDIMGVLLTIYLIEEKNKKIIKFNRHNPLQMFIVLNIIYFLLALVNEIIYGFFTFLTPITFCFLIYFQIFYYQNPNDIEHSLLSQGAKFIAVSEYYKGLIHKKRGSIKITEEKNGVNNKKYIPMDNIVGRVSMLESDNNEKDEDNDNKENRKGSNEENNNINKLINNLYNPDNSDYLQNSYEGILNISVKFQSNFFINYGTYQNNKNKENDKNNQLNDDNKDMPLLNGQCESDSNPDDNFDVANFYTSIIFNFNVIAQSSYYVTNKNLSKSLDEFFQLDNIIENEFTVDRYNASLIKNLPKLNLKQCFEILSINAKKGFDFNSFEENSDTLLDCIQNTKNICEKYLKEIISNPHFIIPEVLIFLEIRDKNVFQIYININEQIKKKERKFNNNNGFNIISNFNFNFAKNEFNSKINLKIIKGDFINNNQKNKNKKDKKDANNNYIFLISLNYEECTKFVRKKLEETIFILQEFNKLLSNNYNNNINLSGMKNTKKEVNTNLKKNFSEFIKIVNKINGTSFKPNQSFKLKSDKINKNIFKPYSSSDKNKEDDLFFNLVLYIENILQLLINNYLEDIFNSNQIIKEYFFDFFEDYWSVDILKKNIKYDNNFRDLFQNEISGKSINNIFVLDKNYIYININYHINIFYVLYFKITTNSNFIQIEKKYSFDEVKNYIDLMKVELGLSLVWTKKCFESDDEEGIENIHISRLNLMSTYLNKIFNANKIFNIKNWNKIFFDDKLYQEVCEIKFKEKKENNKKIDEIIDKKNNSIDDFYLSASNQKLKKEIIKENKNILNENMASFELRKSDLYLNDENESMNSFGSLTSNISKNSNVKNLINI